MLTLVLTTPVAACELCCQIQQSPTVLQGTDRQTITLQRGLCLSLGPSYLIKQQTSTQRARSGVMCQIPWLMDLFGDADGALEKASGSWITLESIGSDQGHSFQFPG
jgi:hypothetical protein